MRVTTGPILGVGLDIADSRDVSAALREFGDRYLHRVFTPHEIRAATLQSGEVSPGHLAVRFAVKEAVFKILATPSDASWDWRWVEAEITETGEPLAHLSGAAYDWADLLGIQSLRLSVARSGSAVTAVAVACGVTGDTG